MVGLSRLTFTEFKLFVRDPTAVFFVLALPLGMLAMLGSMFSGGGLGDSPYASGGFVSAMSVSMSIGILALFTIPTYLATYREKGILRRLSVTPVRPATLLVAQLVVSLVMALVGAALVIAVGNVALGISVPQNLPGFLLAFMLSVSAMFVVGLLIAAIAPSGRAANSIGALLFFPLLFFAGVWMPKELMPEVLGRIADFTPMSATIDSLRATWEGGTPQTLDLAVLVAITGVVGAVAARVFRWE